MYKLPDVLVPKIFREIEAVSPVVAKDDLKLLDIGAGSGLIGQKFAAGGFSNLTATDLSPKMLALAEKKGIYKALVCDSLYNWRRHFKVGQFDVVFSCSVFTPGQLKPNALDEIICLVKPGESVCLIVVR